MEMERGELAMETFGLSVAEGKMTLHGGQDFVASQQAQEDLQRRRNRAGAMFHPPGLIGH